MNDNEILRARRQRIVLEPDQFPTSSAGEKLITTVAGAVAATAALALLMVYAFPWEIIR